MARRGGKSSTIGTVLEGFIERKGWQRRFRLYHVFNVYDAVVGPDIAEVSAPLILHGTVLWIGVADSVWMHMLHLQKPLLLEKLNNELGEEKLSDIRFRLDPSLWKRIEKGERAPSLRPVDREKLSEFDKMTAELPSEEVRAAMRRFWVKWNRSRG